MSQYQTGPKVQNHKVGIKNVIDSDFLEWMGEIKLLCEFIYFVQVARFSIV